MAEMTGAPKVRLGTKCPSITSMWIQSAPASSSARTSSPSRAKSAERMDALMRTGRLMPSDDLRHGGGGIGHAIGEAPFVVIPAHDAHQRSFYDLGLVHMEDRGMGIAVEIDRHIGAPGEGEDTLEFLSRCALDGAVHFLDRGRLLRHELEID